MANELGLTENGTIGKNALDVKRINGAANAPDQRQ